MQEQGFLPNYNFAWDLVNGKPDVSINGLILDVEFT